MSDEVTGRGPSPCEKYPHDGCGCPIDDGTPLGTGRVQTPCDLRVIAGHSNVVLRCEAHDWQKSYGYSIRFGQVGYDATTHVQEAKNV